MKQVGKSVNLEMKVRGHAVFKHNIFPFHDGDYLQLTDETRLVFREIKRFSDMVIHCAVVNYSPFCSDAKKLKYEARHLIVNVEPGTFRGTNALGYTIYMQRASGNNDTYLLSLIQPILTSTS